MKRVLVSVLLCLGCVGMVFSHAAGQTLPPKKEVAVVLARAESQTALVGPQATPFHLHAKLAYKFGKVSFDGMYDILWFAPDRYREQFQLGPASSTYLVLRDKLYIERSTPVLTYPQWRVRLLTGFPKHEAPPPSFRVSKVYAKTRGSDSAICGKIANSGEEHTDCYSPADGELVSLENKVLWGTWKVTLDEDGYASIGAARFPRHILSTIQQEGAGQQDESLEIQVDGLEPAPRIDGPEMVPPKSASQHDWCAEPRSVTSEGQRLITTLFLSHMWGGYPAWLRVAAYYVQAAPDGSIENISAIFQDGSAMSVPATEKEIYQERVPVHACGGKPIEYETVLGAAMRLGEEVGPSPDGLHGNPPIVY